MWGSLFVPCSHYLIILLVSLCARKIDNFYRMVNSCYYHFVGFILYLFIWIKPISGFDDTVLMTWASLLLPYWLIVFCLYSSEAQNLVIVLAKWFVEWILSPSMLSFVGFSSLSSQKHLITCRMLRKTRNESRAARLQGTCIITYLNITGLKRALSTANSSQSEAEQHQRNGDPITGTSAQATEHPDLPYGDSEIGKWKRFKWVRRFIFWKQ